MEVDQRLDGEVTVVIGPGLEREQRVDIDGPDLEPLLGRVVWVDVGPGAGVHHLARVPGVRLRETE